MTITITQNVIEPIITVVQDINQITIQPTILSGGGGGGGAVDSVNGKTGVVVLTPDDIPRRTLTNATVTGTQDLDYDLYESFIFTLTGNVTLTESNVYNKIFTMSVTGDFAITYPSGWSAFVSGVYDGTVQNTFTVWRISVGVYKVQISQPS